MPGETLLGRLLDVSYPTIVTVGGFFLLAGLGCLVAALIVWRRRPRARLVLGLLCLVFVVLGILAITDLFCVAGYLTPDGSCAWE
jgi:hypothetical protein